jgi:hypothetical protein
MSIVQIKPLHVIQVKLNLKNILNNTNICYFLFIISYFLFFKYLLFVISYFSKKGKKPTFLLFLA